MYLSRTFSKDITAVRIGNLLNEYESPRFFRRDFFDAFFVEFAKNFVNCIILLE